MKLQFDTSDPAHMISAEAAFGRWVTYDHTPFDKLPGEVGGIAELEVTVLPGEWASVELTERTYSSTGEKTSKVISVLLDNAGRQQLARLLSTSRQAWV